MKFQTLERFFHSTAMTLSRKLEIICAISSALLGVVVFADVFLRDLSEHNGLGERFQVNSGYVFEFLIFAFPGLIIVVAAYAHAMRNKIWGFVLLMLGGLLNSALLLVYAFGILWVLAIFHDILGLFAIIVEFLLVITTLVAAVATFMSGDPFGKAL
jgi:hypothetical protein